MKHGKHYFFAKKCNSLNFEVRARTNALSILGMSPSQILSLLRATWHIETMYDEVYQAWLGTISAEFWPHRDSCLFAQMYVNGRAS